LRGETMAGMVERQPSAPHPWLTPTIASLAFLFGCVLWPYLQIRHWKDPGEDYLSIWENIVLFAIAWGLLGWAVVRNIRDARRANDLRAQLVTIKDELKLARTAVRSTPAIIEQPHEPATIQAVHTWVVEATNATYPLKIRYQMRNTSLRCADVTTQGYKLTNPLISKQVVSEVLQLKVNSKWSPEPDGVPRIAILPGQEFRGWIAANDGIFKKEQIEKQIGKLGAIVLLVDGNVVAVNI
jgi:hypothetical protein